MENLRNAVEYEPERLLKTPGDDQSFLQYNFNETQIENRTERLVLMNRCLLEILDS